MNEKSKIPFRDLPETQAKFRELENADDREAYYDFCSYVDFVELQEMRTSEDPEDREIYRMLTKPTAKEKWDMRIISGEIKKTLKEINDYLKNSEEAKK